MTYRNGTHICILYYINETVYIRKLLLFVFFVLSKIHENIVVLFLKEFLTYQKYAYFKTIIERNLVKN